MRSSRAWRSKIYCRKGRLKDKAPSDLSNVEEKDPFPRFYLFRSLVVLNCCTSDIFWRQASLVFSHSTAFEGSIFSQATRLLVSRRKHHADWTPYIILSDNALMIIIFVRLELWDNNGKLNYYFVCGGNKLWYSGRELHRRDSFLNIIFILYFPQCSNRSPLALGVVFINTFISRPLNWVIPRTTQSPRGYGNFISSYFFRK